jgi:hypothetical protein
MEKEMNYDEVVAAAASGDQTPDLVSAAFAVGEAKMALAIAQGTYWRCVTGTALPVERRTVNASYTIHGEGCDFVGAFTADYVVGTDLCMVVAAPQGAQFSDDRLNRLVAV